MMSIYELLEFKKSKLPVWYLDLETNEVCSAEVVEAESGYGYGGGFDIVVIREYESDMNRKYRDFVESSSEGFAVLFPTREALESHIAKQTADKVKDIRSSINTKEDLIRFMFNNTAEERKDSIARETVRQIAFEKWGIEL